MAVARCTSQFYYNDGSDKTQNIVGCGYNDGVTITKLRGGVYYDVGNGYFSVDLNEYYDTWYFSGLINNAYYYNFKQGSTFAKALAKGTGKSYSEIFEGLAAKATEKVALGETFTIATNDYAEYTSKQQGLFGISANGKYLVPEIVILCSSNSFNPGDMSRNVTMNLSLFLHEANWDSTNNKWSFTSDRRVTSQGITTTNWTLWEDILSNTKNDATGIYLSVGPGWNWTDSYPGYDNRTFSTPKTNETYIYMLFKTTYAQTMTANPYIIQQFGYVNKAWNSSGTIDPVDPFIDPDDPYDPIDPDDPEPGDPEPVDPDDPLPEPDIPDIGGVSVGIYKAYKPTSSQLSAIANKLWDPDAWAAIKQMFTNPMESILGLAIIPVNPITGTAENVYLGRYNTEVQVPRIVSDYTIIDCGTIPIKKFYGSYLDYDPYTKYTLHLPYVGELDLNADEIVGKNMQIKYHCNVITGDCTAYVLLNGNVAYLGSGNFIRQLPISQTDYTNIIQTAVSAVASIATAAVAGAGGAAVSGALDASSRASDLAKISANNRVSSAVVGGTTSLLTDVMNSKYSYKHSGKVGQGAGQLSVQKPFITVIRPNLALPEGNDAAAGSSLRLYTGYPSNKIASLGDCHGFTQVESCRLSIPDATDEEIAEVYSLLKGGVIL